jgi:uncharacterized protein YndB with AHSA1/START domain
MNTLKLAASGDLDLVMTRAFDAPPDLVFDAFTKPDLVRRWLLGPRGWSMPVCEVDLKVGGRYRYVWRRDTDGTEMGMGGVYREIVRPERIVYSEKFDEAWYEGESMVTITFHFEDGKTIVTTTMRFQSRETRDDVLESGMESGVETSYQRLDDILAGAKK